MAALYGQIEGEPIMQGVQVFSEAYRRANLPVLAWLFSRPWLRPLHDRAYRIFVRNRHSISQLLGPLLLRIVQYGKH
jgi:predicted DCC family thiol-disulfide oxidoreductase YuxK